MQHLVCERSGLQWPERTSNSAQLRPAVGQMLGRTFLQSSTGFRRTRTDFVFHAVVCSVTGLLEGFRRHANT